MNTKTKPRPSDNPERLQALPKPAPESRNLEVIDAPDRAEAASAHSHVNVPMNLNNWKGQPPEIVDQLTWFHQWLIDQEIGWDEAAKAIQGDRSTVFKILKGTYAAKDWSSITSRIKSFRAIQAQRDLIRQSVFVPNRITKMISAGLDYAMANNSICLIVGESRLGKTEAGKDWMHRNNHGRTVMIEVPPIGGPKAVLLEAAKAVGVNRNSSVPVMLSSVVRAFNHNRMLLVDEVHRCLSSSRTATPVALEVIRYIRDRSGCAVGMFATQRFTAGLSASTYQYEQLVGRIGMPILLPNDVIAEDIMPLVQQYIANPSDKLTQHLLTIANQPGRFGVLTEILKFGSRIASKSKTELAEKHILDAITVRKQMQGGNLNLSK